MFLASNVNKVAVISGSNSWDGSMGPGGYDRGLDLEMGALTGAQWVRNDRLRGSFILKSPFLSGVEWQVHGLQCRPSDCDF